MSQRIINLCIVLLILLTQVPESSAYELQPLESDFRPECYNYYAKVQPGVMLKDESYKILIEKDIDVATQDGKVLPIQLYKNSNSIVPNTNQNFGFLNDWNKKTFIEIDTRTKKEFIIELEAETIPWGYDFNMDIDSKFHNTILYISDDDINYSKVSALNVEDFWFKYFKIVFENDSNTDEIIKIRELSFKNKSKTYILKSFSNSHIEIFSDYICEWEKKITPNPYNEFDIDIETKNLKIPLIKNPKFDVFSWVDTDNDWIDDSQDNCLGIYNPQQKDTNWNGVWDACSDEDDDGIFGIYDNCPSVYNPDQEDINRNGVGFVCEFDSDEDSVPDGIDNCINSSNPEQEDDDNDGIGNVCDNCEYFNPNQFDQNENGQGDVCEKRLENIKNNDSDDDMVIDSEDNCPNVSNPDQEDSDKDGIGNVCDNCVLLQNTEQKDINENGVWDMCEDTDKDNLLWYRDNCMDISNPDQADSDNDGIGDVCEDDDGDGILFLDDNCPYSYNKNQKDRDKDGAGDVCDETDDRVLESNKTFFLFLLAIAAIIFLWGIVTMFQKINSKK